MKKARNLKPELLDQKNRKPIYSTWLLLEYIWYKSQLELLMAKPATIQIKLVSTADTGFYYVTKKNPRTKPEKLEFKKYDPKARKHVIFKEAKIK